MRNGIDRQWFRIANRAGGAEFYRFKSRMLQRFGTMVGYDEQTIQKICWSCDGSGVHWRGGQCFSCAGTGIYGTRTHYLQRWEMQGDVYHIPVYFFGEIPEEFRKAGPVQEFEGLIHQSPSNDQQRAGDRAFLRLLLRYEPMEFYRVIVSRIQGRSNRYRVKLLWKLMRLRERIELWPIFPRKQQVHDEVPF